jgi:hypothetical protein
MLYLHFSNGDNFCSFLLCYFCAIGSRWVAPAGDLLVIPSRDIYLHFSLVVFGIIFQDGKDVGQTWDGMQLRWRH